MEVETRTSGFMGADALARHLHLGPSHVSGAVEHLPLEVRRVHHVEVHQAQASDARPRPGTGPAGSRAHRRRSAGRLPGEQRLAVRARPTWGRIRWRLVALELVGAQGPGHGECYAGAANRGRSSKTTWKRRRPPGCHGRARGPRDSCSRPPPARRAGPIRPRRLPCAAGSTLTL